MSSDFEGEFIISVEREDEKYIYFLLTPVTSQAQLDKIKELPVKDKKQSKR